MSNMVEYTYYVYLSNIGKYIRLLFKLNLNNIQDLHIKNKTIIFVLLNKFKKP